MIDSKARAVKGGEIEKQKKGAEQQQSQAEITRGFFDCEILCFVICFLSGGNILNFKGLERRIPSTPTSHLFKRKHENSRDGSDGGENLCLDSWLKG